MNIEMREVEGVLVVALAGEVDLQHSPRLRKTLMELMFQGRDVMVEMAAVDYIDSSGVAGLVEAFQMARSHNTRLVLVAVSEPARRVLHLARLDRVFSLAETLDDALRG